MLKKLSVFVFIVSLCFGSLASATLSQEQKENLFEQGNEYFRQANSVKNPDQAKALYEKAILNFSKIIDEGNVKNARLYYNIANAYFLDGRIGKAIVNYRRAENLDSSDENIAKNLAFARTRRIDKVPVNTEKRVLQTLFFWHYDFSLKTKFILTCVLFGVLCLCAAAVVRFGLTGPLGVAMVICVLLTILFLSSVVIDSNSRSRTTYGVITAAEVVARQGDGQNYSPSFKDSLHEGTEFRLLEKRPHWFHIELTDDSSAWIPSDSADLI